MSLLFLECIWLTPLVAQNKKTTTTKPKNTTTVQTKSPNKPKPNSKADLMIKGAWYIPRAPYEGYILEIQAINKTDSISFKNLYCNGYKEPIIGIGYLYEKKYPNGKIEAGISIPSIGSEYRPEYPKGDINAPIPYAGWVLIEYKINGKLKYISVPKERFVRPVAVHWGRE